MKFICTSLGCTAENPVDYCKECSHANWIVDGDLTFNPRFGPKSKKEIDWNMFGEWLTRFEKIDINKTSFEVG